MKKKSMTMIISVICLVGLTGGYLCLKNYNDAKEVEEEQATQGEVVWETDTEEVTGISFWIDDTEYHFVKEEDSWKMSEDETFPVSASALMTVLENITPLKAKRILDDVETISEYGMGDPQNQITVTHKDGSETVLTIGDTNEGTEDDYLMLDDSDVIYTVDAAIRENLSNELYDYAAGETFPNITASDVRSVAVERNTGGFTLEKEDDVWKVTADGMTEEAYESYANQLLSEIGSMTFAELIEHNCQDFAAYGLEEPSAVVTITYENGDEEETLVLYVGDTDDSQNYYVNMDGSIQVHTVSSITMGDLLEYEFDSLIEPETEGETEVNSEIGVDSDSENNNKGAEQ